MNTLSTLCLQIFIVRRNYIKDPTIQCQPERGCLRPKIPSWIRSQHVSMAHVSKVNKFDRYSCASNENEQKK